MWTIVDVTGETVLDGTDPVLFMTEAEALAWADKNIDPDEAREYAIVDVETL